MSVFLCILIVFLTVLGTDLQASVKIDADVLGNSFFIKFFIFGISIMRVRVSLTEFDLRHRYLWLKFNEKPVGVALTTDRENEDSILNYMSNPLVEAIDFKYFDLSVTLGLKNDPFLSAMALQALKSGYAAAVAVIKSKQDLDARQHFVMDCSDHLLKFAFFGIISLTLANIIFSFLVAFVRKIGKNYKKYRRNRYDHKHGTEAHRKSHG